MNRRRLSIGDFVVWKANANAKAEQYGFVCKFDSGMARMLVMLGDPDIINKHRSLQGIDLEIRGRNRDAVERAEIATNVLEWPLDMVVLWYAAKNHVLNRGYWDLGAVVDLCQRKMTDMAMKKALVERLRNYQRITAMNAGRRRSRLYTRRARVERGYSRR